MIALPIQQAILRQTGTNATDFQYVQWQAVTFPHTPENCAEIAKLPHACIAMRDSKNPAGPVHIYGSEAFAQMIDDIKNGSLDQFLREE